MIKIKLSKKALWTQIIFGIICGINISSILLKSCYTSEYLIWVHTFLAIWTCIFMIDKLNEDEFYTTIRNGQLTGGKKFLSIFLGVALSVGLILFSLSKFSLHGNGDVLFFDFSIKIILLYLSITLYSLVASNKVKNKSI